MALSTILAAIVARLDGMPGIATVGLTQEQPYRDDPAGDVALPALLVNCDAADVDLGEITRWAYPVDVLYLHAERGGDIGGELAAIYDVPRAIVVRLSGAQTLGGLTYGYGLREGGDFGEAAVVFGPIGWRDTVYVGAAIHTEYVEKHPLVMKG